MFLLYMNCTFDFLSNMFSDTVCFSLCTDTRKFLLPKPGVSDITPPTSLGFMGHNNNNRTSNNGCTCVESDHSVALESVKKEGFSL